MKIQEGEPNQDQLIKLLRNMFGFSLNSKILLFSSARSGIQFVLMKLAEKNKYKNQVVVPSYACKALLDCITNSGLEPVYVDVDETMMPGHGQILSRISDKTLACFFHNLAGQSNFSTDVLKVCEINNVVILDDHCQSFFLEKHQHNNIIHVMSFGFSKTVSATAGGCIVLPPSMVKIGNEYEKLPQDTFADSFRRFMIYSSRHSSIKNAFSDRIIGSRPVLDIDKGYYSLKRMSCIDAKIACEVILRIKEIQSKLVMNYNDFIYHIRRRIGDGLFLESKIVSKEALLLHFRDNKLKSNFEKAFTEFNIELQQMYIPLHLHLQSFSKGLELNLTENYYKNVLYFPVRHNLTTSEKTRILLVINRGKF